MLPDISQCPLGGEITPVWEHCLTSVSCCFCVYMAPCPRTLSHWALIICLSVYPLTRLKAPSSWGLCFIHFGGLSSLYWAWHIVSAAWIFVEHTKKCDMELGDRRYLYTCFSIKPRAINYPCYDNSNHLMELYGLNDLKNLKLSG